MGDLQGLGGKPVRTGPGPRLGTELAADHPSIGSEPDSEQPLSLLGRWLDEAQAAGVPEPRSVAFITVGA